MNIVSDFKNFDFKDLNFSQPKINNMGGQSVYINNKSSKLTIQTPKCYIPFGISSYQTNYGMKYNIDLSLKEQETNDFKQFLNGLDEYMIDTATKNGKEWFKKELKHNVVDELYKKTLKKSDKFPPLMKMKFPCDDKGEFQGEVYDASGNNLISTNKITKGCSIQVIAEMVGVYFVAKEFGITWKVLQIRVYPNKQLQGFSFVDDDVNEEDVLPP
tara:strand:+ start:279 stop:923 length:645 start_codon:yes stop_codon:yes gene_type:complete